MIQTHTTKDNLLFTTYWNNNASLHKISSNNINNCSSFVPQAIIDKYKTALKQTSCVSEYDIVYYIGKGGCTWSPYDTHLGGSEQAVKHLVEAWTKQNMSVAVYGDFTPEITEKTKNDPTTGVYFNYMNFKCSTQYNILILWRNYGVHPAILWPIKAKKVYVDVHDICKIAHTCDDNMDKVTCFVVRSKFHMNGFKSVNKAFKHNTNIVAIPNGVRVSDFTPPDTVERDI